jgi:hypothetical protein
VPVWVIVVVSLAVASHGPLAGHGPALLADPTLYKDVGSDTMQSFGCVGLAIWNQNVAVVNPAKPNQSGLREADDGHQSLRHDNAIGIQAGQV